MSETLREGWYLMSVSDLEIELARIRDPRAVRKPSRAVRLSTEEALAYRNAGNVPDEDGRSLRLVLRGPPESLATTRLRFEPDFHRAPAWRRTGSKPVNVVPLPEGREAAEPATEEAWWEHEDVAALEAEWRRSGTVAGVAVPAAYRSFVFKTAASLRSAGFEVTADSILASVARWLSPDQVAELENALREANP